jgi:multidrug efflux pump subunit AcrB
MKRLQSVYKKDGQDRLLPRLSLFVFDRSRTVAIIWLCLTLFGLLSYTALLKREGFPSVSIPFTILSGTYFINDAEKVDLEVSKPISDIALKDNRVKSVNATAQAAVYSVVIQYKDGTDENAAGKDILKQVQQSGIMPPQATIAAQSPKFGFTSRGDDMVIAVYAKGGKATAQNLLSEGKQVAGYIQNQHLGDIESVSVVNPFVEGKDPHTGRTASTQTTFDRYAQRTGDMNAFYDSVSVGIMQKKGTDVIKLDEKVQNAVDAYNRQHADSPYTAVVSATYAHDIKDQISELQKALFEGLLAVLVVGSIIIAVRASLVTVISMATVLAITIGVLYVIGYTLNTITLFSLILCLGLIVDDTIIMIEAIDAQRRRMKDPRETVHEATRKVSRAMVAATTTAALSFAPLIFVGGVLGGFIRAIPITVISSLLISLLVALIFIPFFARYLLLGKEQMGPKNIHEPAASIEARIAHTIGKPMIWAKDSKKRLFGVGSIAVVIGLSFILAGVFLFTKVTFNIFPPTKDTNGVTVTLDFVPGTTISQAEAIADRADTIVAAQLGDNLTTASYFANATTRQAIVTADIISYQDRDITSPELVKQLQTAFAGFSGAEVKVGQVDIGPPVSAFTVQVKTENRMAGMRLAKDINAYLNGLELTRTSGEKAHITSTSISDPGSYNRSGGQLYIAVTGNFDADDTSTLVTLAQNAVKKEFNADKLHAYGLKENVLSFDLGQEGENQDSFKTLAYAFPVLLLIIYLLLSIQFRSLAQPLLIFMAIPFSLFGITLGLYLTNNAFSFFSMLGFFALIGLSIKNTILLTDYANQLRRQGDTAVDAAVGALAERFRPLIATSTTAVVSLIPLLLSSPFWEGLVVVLMFGLLSSTFLVIVVFPYYYLGAEYIRLRVSRRICLTWLALSIVLTGALAKVNPATAVCGPIIALAILVVLSRSRRHKAKPLLK